MFHQVFLDVVESVNILVNSNGQIIRSDVVGALKMRTYLRYMTSFFTIICLNGGLLGKELCVVFIPHVQIWRLIQKLLFRCGGVSIYL